MKKLYICGLTQSGKGLLRPLLDGHRNIFNCPFQGFGFGLVSSSFDQLLDSSLKRSLVDRTRLENTEKNKIKLIKNKIEHEIRVSEIIDHLFKSNSGLSQFIDSTISKKIRSGSSQKNELFVEFQYDIHQFFSSFSKKIINVGSFYNLEELQDCFFEIFIKNYKNLNKLVDSNFYFMQSAPNKIETINSIIENSKNYKIIVVIRDPIARAFTNAKHVYNRSLSIDNSAEENNHVFFSNRILRNYNSTLYSKSFLSEMATFYKTVYDLSKTNKLVKIINFENLVYKTKSTMEEISRFLEINYNDNLTVASLNSIPLQTKNVKFTGKINDDPKNFLSSNQINFIKFLYNKNDHSLVWYDKIKYSIFKLIIFIRESFL